jgi:hypothetical protein
MSMTGLMVGGGGGGGGGGWWLSKVSEMDVI